MADTRDDWRIRIEIGDEEAPGLFERLGLALGDEASELARELEKRRLAVSYDDDEVFVYAASPVEAERARAVIQAELRDLGAAAVTGPVEHWLEDEERWDDEPPEETWEADQLERGYAPWEVRVSCDSHRAARELADRLEQEGFSVERRYRHLIVGTASKEEATALAARLHGDVEPGGELVWETVPGNPFAVFGGLGGSGTPLG
jgi:hypothetical protein